MGVDDNCLADWAVFGSAELVQEVAEVVKGLFEGVRAGACYCQLDLDEESGVFEFGVYEEVAVRGLDAVLYAVDGQLWVSAYPLEDLFYLGQVPAAFATE